MNYKTFALIALGGTALITIALGKTVHLPSSAKHNEAAEQEHKPRHGGLFGDADDIYHLELVVKPAQPMKLYVSNDFNHPLDVRKLKGKWTIDPGQGEPLQGAWIPASNGDYFESALPQMAVQPDPLPVKVEVLHQRDWVTMEFYVPKEETQQGTAE